MADWNEIKADFLATGLSYPQLAQKYGVSISTLKKRAAREKWTGKKDNVDLLVLQEPGGEMEPDGTVEPLPTVDEIVEGKRDRLAKFLQITDAMMDRIQEAIQSPDVVSPYSLKLLASALRDLREMQGLNRTALDIEEQIARIAKIKSDTRIVEESEESGVIILPAIEDDLTPPEVGDA